MAALIRPLQSSEFQGETTYLRHASAKRQPMKKAILRQCHDDLVAYLEAWAGGVPGGKALRVLSSHARRHAVGTPEDNGTVQLQVEGVGVRQKR